MDCRQFFETCISKNKLHVIKNGFQFSDFNPPNVKIFEIVRSIINNYDYEFLKCQQNGIPLDKIVNPDKKMSYCTGFDIIINNLLGIYGYEFSKYIMMRINAKHILTDYLKIVDSEINNFQTLQLYVENFVKLFVSMNIKITNYSKFEEEYAETSFGKRHQVSGVDEIFKCIFSDIHKEFNNITSLEEIKLASIETLNLIIKHTSQSKIVINTLNDLVIDFGDIDIDIGYKDSFLLIAETLYKYGNCTDELLIKYDLKNKITQFNKNIEQWLNNLVEKIINMYPEIKININAGLITYIGEILIDWFINLGINIAILYNITINFEKASRIHFKTIFNAILMNVPKYKSYNPSQLTLIHYVLLNKLSIQKTLKIIDPEQVKKKGRKQEK